MSSLTIEIDFDVYKILTMKRSTEEDTYNDVIRQLLDLPRRASLETKEKTKEGEFQKNDFWVAKGVRFPNGTQFKAAHKGREFRGEVKKGRLVLQDGHEFNNVSPAAVHITGNSVNGWNFWYCRYPNSEKWISIKSLRNRDY